MMIYLSGPMFGYPDDNLKSFTDAARALRADGWQVASPREYQAKDMVPYGVLKAGLHQLLDCTHVGLLEGWRLSRGCLLEVSTALLCGIEVVEVHEGVIRQGPHLQMTDIARLILAQDEHFRASIASSKS